MIILGNILLIIGAILIFLASIAIFKSKNAFFTMQQVNMVNIYAISILLIGFMLINPKIQNIFEIALILILNIIISTIITQILNKKTAQNKKTLKNIEKCIINS